MERDSLTLVWLSVDRIAASDMALLYLRDSAVKGWFKNITLILWGPTVELMTRDSNMQQQAQILNSVGVKVEACIACASLYGAVNKLRSMNIPCLPMGEKLTRLLKEGQAVIFI
ncbi:MAG: hypothetical protein RR315_04905 [Oscillospiraceae bacterium]